jgi:RNA polymerase sigma-70 factor (ECF subfamily)
VKDLQTASEYIEKARNGDLHAIGKLVEIHQQLVYSITWKVLGNKEDAEDAAQETFIKCFRNISSFKGDAAFGTWLCSIAYRCAIDLFNKRKHRNNRLESLPDDINQSDTLSISPGMNTESQEIKLILKQAIDALPSEDALMIMLHYYWDMPLREVGMVLNITESNAKVRLFRSRNKLQVMLKQTNKI